jgi:molybdopterin synthase catalytic subunit
MVQSPVLQNPSAFSEHFCCFTKAVLSTEQALQFCADPEFGAVSLFAGNVRQTNVGRSVVAIDYEGFESLGVHILKKICQEAEDLCNYPLKIYVAHRVGKLLVQESSVLVAVGSVHRDEACTASRYVIEELKHRAPIWKLEHYTDGNSGWVKGHSLCQHRKPSAYFARENEVQP